MRKFSLHAAFIAVAAAAALAACHGTTPYMPAGPTAAGPQTQGVALPPEIARETGLSALPDAGITCAAKPGKVPGTYYVFFSGGNVKKGTFQSLSQYSTWESVKVTKGTPPPTASPTASPTAGPTPAPEYVYYGTYTLKQGAGGCALLIVTKNGKPFKGLKFNGEATGTPKFKVKYVNESFVSFGPLTLTIKGLSAKGGSGTFAMKSTAGKTVNSGTVKLVGRLLAP